MSFFVLLEQIKRESLLTSSSLLFMHLNFWHKLVISQYWQDKTCLEVVAM